jgi:hypothetical protein
MNYLVFITFIFDIILTYFLSRLALYHETGPKHLQISFSGKSLTHFGGLYLLQKFFQKINLRSLLSQYLHFLQRNNRYTAAEEMLALIYPIALGLGRIETSHLLRHNGVFQYLTGLPTYPNPTTIYICLSILKEDRNN